MMSFTPYLHDIEIRLGRYMDDDEYELCVKFYKHKILPAEVAETLEKAED